jgi:hypothetical protein
MCSHNPEEHEDSHEQAVATTKSYLCGRGYGGDNWVFNPQYPIPSEHVDAPMFHVIRACAPLVKHSISLSPDTTRCPYKSEEDKVHRQFNNDKTLWKEKAYQYWNLWKDYALLTDLAENGHFGLGPFQQEFKQELANALEKCPDQYIIFGHLEKKLKDAKYKYLFHPKVKM